MIGEDRQGKRAYSRPLAFMRNSLARKTRGGKRTGTWEAPSAIGKAITEFRRGRVPARARATNKRARFGPPLSPIRRNVGAALTLPRCVPEITARRGESRLDGRTDCPRRDLFRPADIIAEGIAGSLREEGLGRGG